ncbi:MAG: thiolase family protein [Planctomycetales bacterium]|nr:thiolase family protein [Planctomycetales bacterium]
MNGRSRLAILAGVRTPQAKSFGALAGLSAVDLGVYAAHGALERAGLEAAQIDEVIFGNVAGPPDAANIARVISLKAGIPPERIAHTVNRNCASGMESILSAWQAIRDGRSEVVLTGGTESMSNIPLLFEPATQRKLMILRRAKSFWNRMWLSAQLRPKDFKPVVGVQLGLTDPTCKLNMGETAEILAEEFAVSRHDQDAFALASHQKAIAAGQRCFLSGEILPLQLDGAQIRKDVGPREGQSLEQLAKLQPIFRKEGTVTAGNSCPLTDGAVALVLMDEQQAKHLPVHPIGYVSDYAIAGCDPRRMGLGPVYAMAKLLGKTRYALSDFDLFEINEAFAAQVLACISAASSTGFCRQSLDLTRPLGEIPMEKLNVHGGAIALGHPVGASGTRLVLTLARALAEKKLERGIATLCVGGGQGVAMVIETV